MTPTRSADAQVESGFATQGWRTDDLAMMNKKVMRSLLENMEREAEESLQRDSAFSEVLQVLKWEINNDPRVQAAIRDLEARGRRVFSSVVPRIRIRIRGEEGVLLLPGRTDVPSSAAVEQIGRLTEELRSAASAVIMKSRYREELELIVNRAVGASDRFEGIASEIENAGYEVLICLDLSAYAQVQQSSPRVSRARVEEAMVRPRRPSHEEGLNLKFSEHDLRFLKALRIKADKD